MVSQLFDFHFLTYIAKTGILSHDELKLVLSYVRNKDQTDYLQLVESPGWMTFKTILEQRYKVHIVRLLVHNDDYMPYCFSVLNHTFVMNLGIPNKIQNIEYTSNFSKIRIRWALPARPPIFFFLAEIFHIKKFDCRQ